jgi:hypothetical protein
MYFMFINYILRSRENIVGCELEKLSEFHMVQLDLIHVWLNVLQIQCFYIYKCNNFQHSDGMMVEL